MNYLLVVTLGIVLFINWQTGRVRNQTIGKLTETVDHLLKVADIDEEAKAQIRSGMADIRRNL